MEKSFINNLNSAEFETLLGIISRFTVKISSFLIQYQNPKKYAEFCANHIDKKKFHVERKFFAELPNLNSIKLYTPIELKKLISLDDIPDSILSKARKDFEIDFNKCKEELNILPYLTEEQVEIFAEQIACIFKQRFGYSIIIYFLSLYNVQ